MSSSIPTLGRVNQNLRTNQALVNLYRKGDITYQDALAHSLDVEDLKKVLMHLSPASAES